MLPCADASGSRIALVKAVVYIASVISGPTTAHTQPRTDPLNRSASSRRSTARISSRWCHPTLSGANAHLLRRDLCPLAWNWPMATRPLPVAAIPSSAQSPGSDRAHRGSVVKLSPDPTVESARHPEPPASLQKWRDARLLRYTLSQ